MHILARLRSALARWLGRAPTPGRWLEGSTFAFSGFLWLRPWLLPRRRYRLYIPANRRHDERLPQLVLIHGCRQDAATFANGTRIAALADERRFLVLMPDQSDAANDWRCWNWFDTRTIAGKGEAAIVARMARTVARQWNADTDRIVAAGLSSGAALAAVLGIRHADLFGGIVTHSGIACGATSTPFTALAVMSRGPETDVARIARDARRGDARIVPLLAIQGMRDATVAPRHASALARQYLAFNGVDVPAGSESALPPPDADTRDASGARYTVHVREWRRNGRAIVRLVEIDALGHAWSGGDPALPFNDGAAPSASAMTAEWIDALTR
jgi:poly(hydroxyalkanoate) depolymerase family esterase